MQNFYSGMESFIGLQCRLFSTSADFLFLENVMIKIMLF